MEAFNTEHSNTTKVSRDTNTDTHTHTHKHKLIVCYDGGSASTLVVQGTGGIASVMERWSHPFTTVGGRMPQQSNHFTHIQTLLYATAVGWPPHWLLKAKEGEHQQRKTGVTLPQQCGRKGYTLTHKNDTHNKAHKHKLLVLQSTLMPGG